MSRRAETTAIAVILALSALLRLWDLGLMEFKGDEAVAIHLALPMVEGRELPRAGLMSSVGIHNPPLFIYLTAAAATVSLDPVVLTGLLVGMLHVLSVWMTWLMLRRRLGAFGALTAALLFAVATWSVLYGRKLWAQDILPPLSVLTLWVVLIVRERPKCRWIALGPPLLCALWQIHFSAFALIPIAAAAVLTRPRRVAWLWLGAGTLAAMVMLAPYLSFQKEHDWRDVKGLQNVVAGKKADGSPRQTEKRWTLKPLYWAASISSGTSLAYALDRGEDTRGSQDLDAFRSGTVRAFVSFGEWLGHALLILGALLAVRLARQHDLHKVLAVWFLAYVGVYLLVRFEEVWPHYFIILYPAPFALMAVGPAWLFQRSERAAKPLAVLLVGLVAAAHLVNLGSFRGYLIDRGGTPGDYGVAYEHKAALVSWAEGHGLELDRPPGWEYGHMVRMTRAYGDPAAIRQAADALPAPDRANAVRVLDTLRWPHLKKRPCRDGQSFGPLKACPFQR